MLRESSNVEEVTLIANTVKSFETVVTQTITEQEKLFSGCLALSSTLVHFFTSRFAILNASRALLLALENASKTIASEESSVDSLDLLIDDIVETVAALSRDNLHLDAGDATIPPFVTFLIYKAAAITTGKLQADIEPEASLRRLRVLRKALKVIAQRWINGGQKHIPNFLG
jgi:hypothetical protein